MKKLIVLSVIFVSMLCGCSSLSSDSAMNGRFITVETDGYYAIFVDTQTNVMYLKRDTGSNYQYGITVLLNSDGTPMLWDGE